MPIEELFYCDELTLRLQEQAIRRPEQKNVSWTVNLVRKFSKAGDLVMDFFAGRCSIGIARMLLDQHRTFVRCNVDPEVQSAAESDHRLTFAFQVLDPKADIGGSGEVEAATKVFTGEMGALFAKKKATVRKAHPRLGATELKPGHVLQLLGALYENYSRHEM